MAGRKKKFEFLVDNYKRDFLAQLSNFLLFSLRVKNMNCKEVSQISGINANVIHKYVTNKSVIPVDDFVKLCTALRLDPPKVLEETLNDQESYRTFKETFIPKEHSPP